MFAKLLSTLGLNKVGLVIVAAAIAACGLLMVQNYFLRDDLLESERNNGILETAIATQKDTIEAAKANAEGWRLAHDNLLMRMEELSRVQRESQAESRRLREIFSEHNLTALALARPGLIERRINAGSVDAFRVLQRATSGDIDLADRPGATGRQTSPAEPEPD